MYSIKLTHSGMKILKIAHLLGVSCWLGGAVSMIFLNIYSSEATGAGMLHGMDFSSHVIDIWVVITLGLGVCLLTGFLYGLLTPWKFFRFRWVTAKWLVTSLCLISGWGFLGRWESALLALSGTMGNAALKDAAYQHLKSLHLSLSLLQLALLLCMVVISVIKPWKKRT